MLSWRVLLRMLLLLLATLLCLLLIGTCIWLVAETKDASNARHTTATDAHEEYEQGYQPQRQPPITYQEGEQHSAFPPYEHSHAQYQEMEQVQH